LTIYRPDKGKIAPARADAPITAARAISAVATARAGSRS